MKCGVNRCGKRVLLLEQQHTESNVKANREFQILVSLDSIAPGDTEDADISP